MHGDDFRDQVAQIIRARYGNVFVEHNVGGKAADIFFSMRYPGGAPIKIAIEAKSSKNALRSQEITGIYSEYLPAFESKDIDSLWIVSAVPVRAEQAETVQSFGLKLRLFTLDSLYNEIIDFSDYLKFLVSDFEKDDLSQYYIMPRSLDGFQLHEQMILPWLEDHNAAPIAIVAGYGAGKTSYAKFLARHLAETALSNPSAAKPILLQLGSLTKQQSIRGLINSLFSDEFNVDGYKYSIFNILLEQGHFVIILDGFDEMKHAMRRSDILANFDNIRQFMKNTNSKYLLLGRPTPFLSVEDEAALYPSFSIGEQRVDDVTNSKFSVIGLDEFNEFEVEEFFRGFLTKSANERASDFQEDNDLNQWVLNRVQQLNEKKILAIAKRPVHARMLATLAASPTWQISASTEHDLYHHFVTEFLRRELSEKLARAAIPEHDRLAFMEKIAWWLWVDRKTISFRADQVPEHIVLSVRKYFEDDERHDVILREMLIGSVLERRLGAGLFTQKDDYAFYFPHRSYWEYLVGEYIASDLFTARELRSLMNGLGTQVSKFLYERSDRRFVERIYNYISEYKDLVDAAFIKDFAKIIQWQKESFAELLVGSKNVTEIRFVTMAAVNGDIPFDVLKGLLEAVRGARTPQAQAAAVLYANMYFWMASTGAKRSSGAYIRNLNCRFLRGSLEIVGVDNCFNDQGFVKNAIAVSAVVPREASSFLNSITVRVVDGSTWIQFDPKEIALELNKCRTRIERLGFNQDISPPGLKTVLRIRVNDFVDRWTEANERPLYRKLLSQSLPELRR